MTMNAQTMRGDRPVTVSCAKGIGAAGALAVVLAVAGVSRADEAEAIKALVGEIGVGEIGVTSIFRGHERAENRTDTDFHRFPGYVPRPLPNPLRGTKASPCRHPRAVARFGRLW
jgi:hypothetical protein